MLTQLKQKLMESRREFIKKASFLASGAGFFGALPQSIQRALEINPTQGSSFWDAEHVVILMQENRSFDHCFGTLQGVRGFNDPRALTDGNKRKVWLQSTKDGKTYTPFRLNLNDSKATWMSSLPHSWENQIDALNNGKNNGWLGAKQSGNKDYKDMPLTLGYYNREDIPFYYAMADAFTICDQNFCSSLTGTTPNRLYLWSGTIREKASFNSKANVKNEDIDYEKWAKWKTFPERLQEANVPWKIYQNEISLSSGLEGEEDAWLSNFTDNPIEWFENYKVKFAPEYYEYIQKMEKVLPEEISTLEQKLPTLDTSSAEYKKAQRQLDSKKGWLAQIKVDLVTYHPDKFKDLTDIQKAIHQRAFTNNRKDPNYRKLSHIKYDFDGKEREMAVPQSDVLYQFREDVNNNNLPTVSWLVAPENFSDHPGAPWYGAWYLSEAMDILTKNPEVWKKTIFILAYDENDGYFDHIPPYVAPDHQAQDSGKVSHGIDASAERVNIAHEQQRPYKDIRKGPIGLGFRVPLLIASPWTRGGRVCSEVFDHTSVIQFLEKFVSKKTKKNIHESNITEWRRTVCGDLTSVFQSYNGENIPLPSFVEKEPFIQAVHQAQFKQLPSGYKVLTEAEQEAINQNPQVAKWMPQQEKGIRPACAIPYELYVDGQLKGDTFELKMKAGTTVFGKSTKGSPFKAYSTIPYQKKDIEGKPIGYETMLARDYAVKAGDQLKDTWQLSESESGQYAVDVYAPNGFFRTFKGDASDKLKTSLTYESTSTSEILTGNVVLNLENISKADIVVEVIDESYETGLKTINVSAGQSQKLVLNLTKSYNWYDFSVKVIDDAVFLRRYAGHVETGKSSFTDPAMGLVKTV